MAVEPLAMCYPGLAGGTLRERLTPRFRTIQVCRLMASALRRRKACRRAIIRPVMPLWHEITDRWPAILVLWHDQLLRLEGTREQSLLRRSRLPDQRKSRNWHPEILSKHAALQPTRSFALSRVSKSASYNFH